MTLNKITVFAAELVGTFGLLVAATGSVVFDGRTGFLLGPMFVAGMHFVGLSILVTVFGRYSMAHFNPAVTVGFAISGHLRPGLVLLYLVAQTIGAISGSLFVKFVIGNHAKLGLNIPNPSYPIYAVAGAEIIATALLMGVVLFVVGKRLHAGIAGVLVGGIIALDVIFFGDISGASMNPVRSLAPALTTGIFDNLWLYFVAPLAGSSIVAILYRRRFSDRISG